MTPPKRRLRCGMAMLIVLMTVIVITASTVAIVRIASARHILETCAANDRLADDLLVAAQAPIQQWLQEHSSGVVLPPDCLIPEAPVLCDEICIGSDFVLVCITAYDQQGMLPIGFARTSSPLRATVSSEAVAAIDSADLQPNIQAGLDALVVDGTKLFPSRRAGAERRFTDPHDTESIDSQPARDYPPGIATIEQAVGALVGTHNPPLLSTTRQSAINVCTAPVALVEQAMRAAGMDGINLIMEARARGERPNLPTSRPRSSRSASATDPLLVTSSASWSFRVDTIIGSYRRSWWLVYCRTGSTWECLQRLAIPE